MMTTSDKKNAPGWLTAMIDTLSQLMTTLFCRLHLKHLENSKMGEPKQKADLWGQLGEFIQNTEIQDDDINIATDGHLTADHHTLKPYLAGGKLEPSELSEYYQRQHARVELHPHMAEQMQHSTMDHINSALHLAKKGDQQGAKLHIHLAESAMHTAGRFMSQEDYDTFEKRVLKRLQELMNRGEVERTN